MTRPDDFTGDAGSVLRRAVDALGRAGVDSPRLTAELLLAHALGWTRVRVLTHPDFPVPDGIARTFEGLVRRRSAGEPLQYITGEQEFYGRCFAVSPAVLIPRPETEILIEKVLGLAHSEVRAELCFVDVGTGSGCIAVTLAAELPGSRGWGIDISPAALAVASRNALRHRVAGKTGFLCADLLECFPGKPVFDWVVSNPPYIAPADAPGLDRTVREHEPSAALFGGEGGLEIYRRLIPQAAARLRRRGRLVMEIGAGMRAAVTALVEEANLVVETVADDLQGIPRCIAARRNDG